MTDVLKFMCNYNLNLLDMFKGLKLQRQENSQEIFDWRNCQICVQIKIGINFQNEVCKKTSISTILFQICLEIGVHLSCYLVQ